MAPGTTPPVLLYRDTNSWCPFCERNSTNRFSWWRHALLPWLSMIAISGVLVGPPPQAPLHLAPIVVLIWLSLGIGVLRFLQIHKPEAIRRAGGLFVVDETEILS